MHPSVFLELNKFVTGSPNTLLQRLPLGPIPYYVYAAKHRQGQGLTLGPEANWHRMARAHLWAPSATHCPWSWVSSSSMSPMTPHSYLVCLSSKCIKKWEDFHAAHQRGIFRAWNRVCTAYPPVWPEGRRKVKHTISAGFCIVSLYLMNVFLQSFFYPALRSTTGRAIVKLCSGESQSEWYKTWEVS